MTVEAPQGTAGIKKIEDLLARVSARDKAWIEKHLAACDAIDPAHGKLWRRVAVMLAALVPLPPQTSGPKAMAFFVPDGKYRMQVFALEDSGTGEILIFLPDVTTQGVKEKIISKAGGKYAVTGGSKKPLVIEALDASNTSDPPVHLKNMIGWNRKAIKISLATTTTDSHQEHAAEALCALAAKQWAAKA